MKITKEVLDNLYTIEKKNTREIGLMFGVDMRTVSKWMKKFGIPSRQTIFRKSIPDKDTIHELYWTKKMTTTAIAKLFNSTHTSVLNWMTRYGIPIRSNSEAQILSQGTEAITKERLEYLYLVEKKTQIEIAQLYGITQSAIKNKMQQHGIQTRNSHPGAANGMFGRTHTPEAREKIRQANQKQFSDPIARERHALLTCQQIQDGKTGKAYNKLESIVAGLLDEAGIVYEQQYRIGRFLFDFFLPDSNTLIEVHGTFWHADPRRYANKPLSKIQQRNLANDSRKAERAIKDGYRFVVLWEYDVYHSQNPLSVIAW